jgi:hypothetical protein
MSDEFGYVVHNTEDTNNDDANPVTVVAVVAPANYDSIHTHLPNATPSGMIVGSQIFEYEFRAKFPTVEAAEHACTSLGDYARRVDVQAKTTLDGNELQALVELHSRALVIQEWREHHNLSYGFSYRRRRLEYLTEVCGEHFVCETVRKIRREFDPTDEWIAAQCEPTATQE